VGPVWHGSNNGEAGLFASCYRKSILLAQDAKAKSIAFPNISTGVYGYPKDKAAHVAIETVNATLNETPGIELVIFVCFNEENFRFYEEILNGK
jgi:O-acetyl-ADP-ribose deacetylase (regulator of RNase III)